jgi:hypothetical protein
MHVDQLAIISRTVSIESRQVDITFQVVDSVLIEQDERQVHSKDFSFVDITPYSLDPICNSLFIEIMATETVQVTVRDVLGNGSEAELTRITRGIVKKYNRRVFMLRVNGKELMWSAIRNRHSKNKKQIRI